MKQYISKSALVAEIERRINEINLDSIEDWRYRLQREHDIEVMKKILSLIDTLEVKEVQEEPVSEELFEASAEYAATGEILANGKEMIDFQKQKAFMAGAKWQKEQMIANTADAMIGLPYENKDGGYTHLIDVSRPLPVGDNKIAIIFKE